MWGHAVPDMQAAHFLDDIRQPPERRVFKANFVHGQNNLGQTKLKNCIFAYSEYDDIPPAMWVCPQN